jgi:hypothetical protein
LRKLLREYTRQLLILLYFRNLFAHLLTALLIWTQNCESIKASVLGIPRQSSLWLAQPHLRKQP